MTDDPIAVLERELVSAAARQGIGRSGAGAADAERPRRRGRPQRLRTLAAIAAVLIPVLAVAAALIRTSTRPSALPRIGPNGRPVTTTLRSELAVLRRPQRPSDLTNAVRGTAQKRILRSLLRRMAVDLPGGARRAAGASAPMLELVISRRTSGGPELASAFAQFADTSSSSPAGSRSSVIAFSGDVTARRLATAGIEIQVGPQALAVIVPDGVARITFTGPDGTAAVGVRDNVAAVRVLGTTVGAYEASMTMRWYTASRRFIRRVAPPPQPATSPDTADALPPILGVLRRPQTSADRTLPELSGHSGFDPGLGTPDPALARLATTAPWGARIFLVPFTTPTGPGEILDVFGMSGAPENGALFGFSRADIETGQAVGIQRDGGSAPGDRIVVIAPDGVAKVRITVALGPPRGRRHDARSPLITTAPVRGNVAAIQEAKMPETARATLSWLSATGRVVGRFPLIGGGG